MPATKKTLTKKQREVSSNEKRFDYINGKIKTLSPEKNNVSLIKKTTQREIQKGIATPQKKQQESITQFGKVLFLNFKDAQENSVVANKYIFELAKEYIKKHNIYDGLYKIEVIKKERNGMFLSIIGAGENFKRTFSVSNEESMKKKPKNDKLEEAYTQEKTIITKQGEKITKKTPGEKKDFLKEMEERDSVIIDKKREKITIVHPDDIIDEIKTYIKKNDNNQIKAMKIQTATKFFNEGKNRLAETYLQEFSQYIQKQKGEKTAQQTIEKLLNQEENYFHRGNDIDKGAVKLLLSMFGPKKEKTYSEVDHNEVKSKERGIFFDVGGTANGIKIENKNKIILSEHTDNSDEALLSNRPSSTTQMIFTLCKKLGTIKQEDIPQVERFVNFINTVDSMFYQISSIDYPNNYQTILGLHRNIHIYDMFDYFKNPNNNGFETLSEEYMKTVHTIDTKGKKEKRTLLELSQSHKKRIENNIEKFKEKDQKKNFLTYKDTKFIVDISEKKEEQIKDGPQTAGYFDYGYFSIKPEKGNIYIYSPKKLPAMIEGFHTEGDNHFLIINTPTKEDIEKITQAFWTKDDTIKNKIIDRIDNIQEKKDEKILSKEDIQKRANTRLAETNPNDLRIGKKYVGIINNVSGKNIYVYISPSIVGLIKNETKEKELISGNIINVKIKDIQKDETGKTRIALEKAS